MRVGWLLVTCSLPTPQFYGCLDIHILNFYFVPPVHVSFKLTSCALLLRCSKFTVKMKRVPGDWEARQWDAGCGDGVFITIWYHSKRFHMSLLPPSTPDTIEGPLITRFDSTPNEDILAIQDEIEEIVYEAGKSI
jgi:hypothetical protein